MVIPVGPENGAQEIFMVDKDSDGKVSQQAILGGVDQTVRSQHMEMIRRAGKLPLNDETS